MIDGKTLVRTLFSHMVAGILLLIMIPVILVWICLPDGWRYNNRFFSWLVPLAYKCWVASLCIPIKRSGLEYLPTEPAVIVSNHQSALDIPLVGSLLLGKPFIWLGTVDLENNPFIKIVLRRTAVTVDMTTPQRGLRSLLEAIQLARRYKSHIVLFPEGGRYIDGKIHDFFAGFVILAKKTGRPVVPIYISGINTVYPPGSFIIHAHPVTITVGQPMMQHKDEGDQLFCDRVRNWFLEQEK